MDAVEKSVKSEKSVNWGKFLDWDNFFKGLSIVLPLVLTVGVVLAAVFGLNNFINSKIDPVKDLLNTKVEMLKDNQTEMKKRMDSIETKLDHVISKAGFGPPGKKSVSRSR